MYKFVIFVAFLVLVTNSSMAVSGLSVVTDTGKVYNPALGEKVSIDISVDFNGVLDTYILSADGFVVKHFDEMGIYKNKATTIIWDGRDDDGNIVPDEAYFPYIESLLSHSLT